MLFSAGSQACCAQAAAMAPSPAPDSLSGPGSSPGPWSASPSPKPARQSPHTGDQACTDGTALRTSAPQWAPAEELPSLLMESHPVPWFGVLQPIPALTRLLGPGRHFLRRAVSLDSLSYRLCWAEPHFSNFVCRIPTPSTSEDGCI